MAGLHIGALIAAGYPLCLDYHPPSNRVTPNGVGQLPESQARHSQRVQPALSVMTLFPYLLLRTPSQSRLRRASSPYGRAKGRASPARRIEISAQEIRWHRLRRGGYQPPGYFPFGEITSAQSADNAMPNICK